MRGWGREKERGESKREREKETLDYYLGSDGSIYTCSISNLALFRHLISQVSLASSSLWQSRATGSKMNFSSCRPSTTGNDQFTVNNTGFLLENKKRTVYLFGFIFV